MRQDTPADQPTSPVTNDFTNLRRDVGPTYVEVTFTTILNDVYRAYIVAISSRRVQMDMQIWLMHVLLAAAGGIAIAVDSWASNCK
jgi:hypothetical protein